MSRFSGALPPRSGGVFLVLEGYGLYEFEGIKTMYAFCGLYKFVFR